MASAPVLASFAANDALDLTTALNAYLAGLTNPIINAIDIEIAFQPRQLGRPMGALVTSQTGGSAIGTPWTVQIFENTTLALVTASIAAVIAATPGAFYAAPKMRYYYIGAGSQTPRVMGILIANATGGASANWLPT
jgi:hypothetical protein